MMTWSWKALQGLLTTGLAAASLGQLPAAHPQILEPPPRGGQLEEEELQMCSPTGGYSFVACRAAEAGLKLFLRAAVTGFQPR